jgi:subtilase family serine protease
VTTSGFPVAASITETGALPVGVTLLNNGNGTATLGGTPAAGTTGTYPLTLTAMNGVLPNATQAFTLSVTGATSTSDLRVGAVSNPPSFGTPGLTFTVTDTTRNGGTGPAGTSTTRYYLSTQGRRRGAILLAGARSVPALAPGARSRGTATVTLPASVAPGMYALLACADDLNVVTEIRENNNCRASSGGIRVRVPDLVETAVSNVPASISRGSSYFVTDTAQNDGTGDAGASVTRYYLSLTRQKGPGAILLTGSRSVPALRSVGPNGRSTGSTTVTVPSSAVPGTYFLLACSDDTNAVVEANETNNCIASTRRTSLAP